MRILPFSSTVLLERNSSSKILPGGEKNPNINFYSGLLAFPALFQSYSVRFSEDML